jgi:uncharacterized protein
MNHPKFVIQKSGRHVFFHLTASSGEVVLHSELHNWRGPAEDGLGAVKANAPFDDRYDRRRADNGRFYFVLKAANGEVIGTSEMYAAEDAMERAIEDVKGSAPVAGVEA